jgi:hypothetical protein
LPSRSVRDIFAGVQSGFIGRGVRDRDKARASLPQPIASQLGVFDECELARYRQARSRIEAAILRVEELPDGYRTALPGNEEMLLHVAEWVALERRCCPFLCFTIAVGGADAEIVVSITGDEDVKRFLDGEFADGSRKSLDVVSLRRRE